MNQFQYVSFAQDVIFAPGSLVRLGSIAEGFGWQRLLLCTNPSMRRLGTITRLENALGAHLAAVYDAVQPHVPDDQVDEVFQLALQKDVDAIIGLGGGSAIGIVKAAAASLNSHRLGKNRPAGPTNHPSTIPIVAIPTTYAGSEMTATFGITRTHETPHQKITVTDPKIAPRVVLYDPELTLDLPPEQTASTGINALAHCLEALYAANRHPLSSSAAVDGVRLIHSAILACYQNPGSLEYRTRMLQGSYLAGFSLASVSMGLHHGLCHVLGGTAGVPHGIANSILLPQTIRFNAEAVAEQLVPAALAFGIEQDNTAPAIVEHLIQEISRLIRQMDLPQRLREAGIKESDLPLLAQLGFQNRTVQKNPKLISDVSQLERLLREAW